MAVTVRASPQQEAAAAQLSSGLAIVFDP